MKSQHSTINLSKPGNACKRLMFAKNHLKSVLIYFGQAIADCFGVHDVASKMHGWASRTHLSTQWHGDSKRRRNTLGQIADYAWVWDMEICTGSFNSGTTPTSREFTQKEQTFDYSKT